MSGFIDLQVNGYAGVDFNSPSVVSDDQAVEVCRRLQQDGVAKILATVITAPLDEMIRRIGRLADLIEQIPAVAQRIAGIHVEGPFINPADGYVGAHPAAAVLPADSDLAGRLVDAGRGHVRLVTLAPEQDPRCDVIRMLTDRGIVVAAGHCDSSLPQLLRSIDAGLKLFTHLGNGCPGRLHRHDNIIQRVLSVSDRLMISFIADGHHVPTFALRNYLRSVPNSNIVIVTDAISAAGLGPGCYQLSDQTVEVDDDGAAWAAGREHFAGSATTMPRMVEILREQLAATDDQIARWTRHNPARLLDATSPAT